MKIRINNENQETIAECVIRQDEYGNWLLISSENVENVFVDMEQDENIGFTEILDIDLKIDKMNMSDIDIMEKDIAEMFENE